MQSIGQICQATTTNFI